MIDVDAQQGKRIRELVEAGLTPDQAVAKVLAEDKPTPPPATAKKNKYGAVKQEEDGYTFDSAKERNRYRELKLMVDDGAIEDLEVHPFFIFEINGIRIGKYTADFQYLDLITGEEVVEDVKSEPTRKKSDYRLRVKMMKAFHDIDVQEI